MSVRAAMTCFMAAVTGAAAKSLPTRGHGDTAAVWDVFVASLSGIVVALFVGWAVVAVIMYFLARAFVSHQGTFTDTLVVTGLGDRHDCPAVAGGVAFLASALGDTSVAYRGWLLSLF